MREKLTEYSFEVKWVEGKSHYIADALSRAPVFEPQEEELTIDCAINCLRLTDSRAISILDEIRGEEYKQLINCIISDRELKDLPPDHPARKYKEMGKRISISTTGNTDVAMLDSKRIIIPEKAIPAILDELHKSHSGMEKTYKTATQLYYWPGMKNHIRQKIDSCSACMEERPRQARQPVQLLPPSAAVEPMRHVGTDLFDAIGHSWLTLVDRYSGYAWVKKMKNTNTESITTQLTKWFTESGWPANIRTDGGPQFRTEFSKYCRQNGIEHELSSPYNPESNGLAEAAVKNMKSLVKRCHKLGEELAPAVAAWRNMARPDGLSPSQLFCGRRQRQRLPLAQAHTQTCLLYTSPSPRDLSTSRMPSSA